jgi:hypothetical protein
VNTAWTASYQGSGVSGLVCTDKTDSSKVLFFPAAGYCRSERVNNVGNGGGFWSSSLISSFLENAYHVFFYSDGIFWNNGDGRYFGFPVRAVMHDYS